MVRTILAVERNLIDDKMLAVDVPDSVSTEVFPETFKDSREIAVMELYNVGPNPAYYAIGRTCDVDFNFNGCIAVGQAVSFITREKVNVYSVGGCKLGRTRLVRVTSGIPGTLQ